MSPAELKAVEKLRSLTPGDKLQHGRTYYAKILLSGLEGMFGSAQDIATKLQAAGFVAVTVSPQPIDDVPDRAPFPSGKTFWARGAWGGQDKQLGGGAVPSQIRAIWESETEAIDVSKVQLPAPIKAEGPTLKQLAFVGVGLYLLRRGRGRRLLRGFGLRI